MGGNMGEKCLGLKRPGELFWKTFPGKNVWAKMCGG